MTLDRDEWNAEITNEIWVLKIRDTIIQCEMFIIRVLHFSPNTQLPHFYLLNYLSSLINWLPDEVTCQTPIAKTAMSLLQDYYYCPRIVRNKPEVTAISILVLTSQIYGLKVPLADLDNWYRTLCPELSSETIWEIIDEIVEMYNSIKE